MIFNLNVYVPDVFCLENKNGPAKNRTWDLFHVKEVSFVDIQFFGMLTTRPQDLIEK